MTSLAPRHSRLARWLHALSLLVLSVPPATLLLIWLLQAADGPFMEGVLAVILYAPPVAGLLVLLIAAATRRTWAVERQSHAQHRLLLYAGLAIMSPMWLFALWLLIIGFNR